MYNVNETATTENRIEANEKGEEEKTNKQIIDNN